MNRNKLRNRILLIIGICFFIVFSSLETGFFFVYRHQVLMRIDNNLKHAAYTASLITDPYFYTEKSNLDASSEAYREELKRWIDLMHMTNVSDIYLMSLENNQFTFLMDSIDDPDNPEDTTLGDLYEEPPEELLEVVRSGTPLIMDKVYTDEFGTFKSAFWPVPSGGTNLKLYVGCDIEAVEIERTLSQFSLLGGASFILLILLLISLGIVLSTTIFIPLQNVISGVIEQAEAFSMGNANFNHSIYEAGDNELTDMARAFNQLQLSLNQSYTAIISGSQKSQSISQNLTAATETVSAGSQQIETTTKNIARQTESLDEKISESSRVLTEITSLISDVFNQIEHQGTSVTSASAVIEELVATINSTTGIAEDKEKNLTDLQNRAVDGETDLQNTLDSVRQIARVTENVVEKVETVHNIAGQIGLLSLNAAIEAAHAGAHGKGFAVVAEEIGKLAVSTSVSAKDIAVAMDEMAKEMKKTESETESTVSSMNIIIREIEAVSRGMNEVIASMKEMSTGSDDVLNEIILMKDSSYQVQESSRKMNEKTVIIRDLNTDLTNSSRKNRDSIIEISRGMVDISAAISQMSDLVRKNNQIISQFSDDLGGFILAED